MEGGEQAGPVFLGASHMAELGGSEGAAPPRSDGDPDSWRAYYEHPLTAATSGEKLHQSLLTEILVNCQIKMQRKNLLSRLKSFLILASLNLQLVY